MIERRWSFQGLCRSFHQVCSAGALSSIDQHVLKRHVHIIKTFAHCVTLWLSSETRDEVAKSELHVWRYNKSNISCPLQQNITPRLCVQLVDAATCSRKCLKLAAHSQRSLWANFSTTLVDRSSVMLNIWRKERRIHLIHKTFFYDQEKTFKKQQSNDQWFEWYHVGVFDNQMFSLSAKIRSMNSLSSTYLYWWCKQLLIFETFNMILLKSLVVALVFLIKVCKNLSFSLRSKHAFSFKHLNTKITVFTQLQ